MRRRGKELLDGLLECLSRHASVGIGDSDGELGGMTECLSKSVRPGRRGPIPGHLLDAPEQEVRLHKHRLLTPKRAVVVERCDPLCRLDEVRAVPSHSLNEVENRLPGRSFFPAHWLGSSHGQLLQCSNSDGR